MDLYVLAIIFFSSFSTYKPYFIKPMPGTAQECFDEARKENAQQKDLLKSLGDGAEIVCMKVTREQV